MRATVDADVTVLVDGWFDESRGFTPVVPTTVVDNLLVQPGGIRTAASGAVLPDTGIAAVAVQVVATGTTTVGSFSLRPMHRPGDPGDVRRRPDRHGSRRLGGVDAGPVRRHLRHRPLERDAGHACAL